MVAGLSYGEQPAGAAAVAVGGNGWAGGTARVLRRCVVGVPFGVPFSA